MGTLRLREAALRALDAAEAVDDPAERGKHVEVAAALLEQLAKVEGGAGPLALLGYVWYQHPELSRSQGIRDRVESALRAAIELDPRHSRAHLYLGHIAYDQGRYSEAQSEFGAARELQNDFLELKRVEMLVCCTMRIDGLAQGLDGLEAFASLVASRPIEDIHPANLAKTLGDLRPEILALPPGVRRRLLVAATRMDQLGGFNRWLSSLIA